MMIFIADSGSVVMFQCLELYAPSVSWSSVVSCVRGALGYQLMHSNAVMTRALNPAHTHIPWVTFNGVKHWWLSGLTKPFQQYFIFWAASSPYTSYFHRDVDTEIFVNERSLIQFLWWVMCKTRGGSWLFISFYCCYGPFDSVTSRFWSVLNSYS